MEERIRQLEDEVQQLRDRMSNTQYIVDDDDQDYMKVSERIVYLNKVSQEARQSILTINTHTFNGRSCEIQHPDRKRFIKHLMNISKKLSRAKRNIDGVFPTIRRSDRCNVYTEDDYQRFGDTIIIAYCEDHPFNTWGIDATWEFSVEEDTDV